MCEFTCDVNRRGNWREFMCDSHGHPGGVKSTALDSTDMAVVWTRLKTTMENFMCDAQDGTRKNSQPEQRGHREAVQ